MFVLRRQPSDSRLEDEAIKRWPWIKGWYFTGKTENTMTWTGKISNAKLFATSLQAACFRDKRDTYDMRTCAVEMITKKELFEAKLKDR